MADVIRARGVKRSYHTAVGEFWALKGIDADIPEGKLTILKGRSGSGKTTLLNILGALDYPTAGEVFYGDDNIVSFSEHRRALLRRKQIGFVFQSVALIPMMSAIKAAITPSFTEVRMPSAIMSMTMRPRCLSDGPNRIRMTS